MTPGSFVSFLLAAAAVTLAATAATVVSGICATAVAEQQNENDDPAHIATAETAITKTTHNHTSEIFDAGLPAHSMVFRRADFVRRLGFFFFCGLCTKIESDHRGKHRQKILP